MSRSLKRTWMVCALLALVAVPAQAQTTVPTPADVIGFAPGTDYKLAGYDQIKAYFEALAGSTDRMSPKLHAI